jgi:hypothetical protein
MSTESDRVTPAVLETLEEATGTDRLELPPRYETIDTEALDRLIASLSGADDVEPATFQFTYAGHRVSVTADGDVTVSPTE